MNRSKVILFLSLSYFLMQLILFSCSSQSQKVTNEISFNVQNDQEIYIMTFNVENLFDTIHDEGKDDYTYLPLSQKNTKEHRMICNEEDIDYRRKECLESDWSDEILEKKMQRLAGVIREVNQGKGPDILFVQEVENLRVLKMFVNKYLADFNYKEVILLEGWDKRGVDTGLISRFPQKNPAQLYQVTFDPEKIDKPIKNTRGILHTQLELPDGSLMHALGVHFPSQHNKHPARKLALEELIKITATLPKNEIIIVAGDFNVTTSEDEKYNLLERSVTEDFYVSHYIGCGDCKGTHSYKGSWSFLDIMLFSKNLGPNGTSPWYVDSDSIEVINQNKYHISRFFSPERFGMGERNSGVSDHWPLGVKLKKRKN